MARLRKLRIARPGRGRRPTSAPLAILAIAVMAATAFGLTGGFTGARAAGANEENRRLREDVEILKRVTAIFAAAAR
jgi:hypothetical protein